VELRLLKRIKFNNFSKVTASLLGRRQLCIFVNFVLAIYSLLKLTSGVPKVRPPLFALMFVVFSSAFAQTEPPQFMTVDGRLYDSSSPTDPLLDASVLLKIQVLNPAKTCILYEEEQTVSTLSSNGYFNVRVGSPTSDPKRSTDDSNNSMMQVFQNQNASIAGRNSSGSGVPCSYTPGTGDSRFFRFIVTPSSTGVTSQLSPDMTIDSVPQALVAESLQGLSPDSFIQVNANTTQAKADNIFGAGYAALTNLISGTSSLYLQNTVNGTVIPNRATDPGSPTAGQIWYDSVANALKYYNGSTVQTLSTGVSADPTKLPLTGGAMTGNINMGGNQILGVGHITQNPQSTITLGTYTTAQQGTLTAALTAANKGATWFNSDTNKMMYWDGTVAQVVLDVATAGTVGDITAVTAGTGLTGGGVTGAVTLNVDIGTGATQLFTNNAVDSCSAGQMLQMSPGPIYDWSCIAINDSSKLALAGGTMTGSLNMDNEQELRLSEADVNGANYVALKSPAILGSNVTFTLPAVDGANGQVLQTDGAGNLSFVAIASAPVSSVFGRTGAVVSANGDYTASQVTNVAAGAISGNTVQLAINELDTEKVAKAGDTMTGQLTMTNNITLNAQNQVRYADSDSSNYVAIQSPGTVTANYTLTLPDTAGTNGQVLSTNGSGVLSWITPSTVPANNSLDFTHFVDNMTLDASTDIAANGTNVLSVTNDGAGNSFVVNDNGSADTSPFVIDSTGRVGIGTTTPSFALSMGDATAVDGAIIAQGYGVNGTGTTLSISGAGKRMIWYPRKSAFRAGYVNGTQWDDANIGNNSIALGNNVRATNTGAIAIGDAAAATNVSSTAIGLNVTSSGGYSTAVGVDSTASGSRSHVFGAGTASGTQSTALGADVNASGTGATALGFDVASSGTYSVGIGAGDATGARPVVSGNNSVGVFMGDQSGVNVSTANVMSILGGNVGIGTTAPAAKLDVEGTIQIADGGELCAAPANAGMVRYSAGTIQYCNGSAWQTLGVSGAGLTTFNSQTGSTQTLAIGSTGLAPNWSSASDVHTLHIPLASGAGVTSGTISKTDYDAFNAKVAATRAVNTAAGSGLTGGGDLSVDRNLAVNITGTTAETVVAGTDEILIWDVSANALRKMTRTNFVLSEAEVDAFVANNGYALATNYVAKAGDTMTGQLTMTNNITLNAQNQVRFADSDSSNFVAIQSPTTVTADYTLTLPDTAGTNGQVLSTNGTGVLSWITPTSVPANNSLNFSHFVDSMTLDASTDIAVGGNVLSITNDGSGNSLVVNDNGLADTSPFIINSVGRVGIGTATPGRELHIYNSADAVIRMENSTGTGQIQYESSNIWQFRTNGVNPQDTRMSVRASGVVVGSGTSAPAERLDVLGSILSGPKGTLTGEGGAIKLKELAINGADTIGFRAPDSIASPILWELPGTDGSSGQVLQTNGSGILSWVTPATGSGDFLANGSVAMTGQLQAISGDASTPGITFDGDENTGIWHMNNNYISFSINAINLGGFSTSGFGVNGVMDSLITSGGQFNAKKASLPVGAEEIIGTYNFKYLNNSPSAAIRSLSSEAWTSGSIEGSHITFLTSANGTNTPIEKLRITSNGNIGIGTVTPGTLLDVAGAITSRPFGTATGETGQLILRELASNGTDTATIRAPDAMTASYALTLPVDAGTSGQLLQTNGAGVLSWVNPATLGAQDLDDLSDVVTNYAIGGIYIGQGSGAATPTGLENTFVGINAGGATTTGTDNVYVGARAGSASVGGSLNVFVGEDAGRNAISNNNVVVGANANSVGVMTGGNNTFVGNLTGRDTTTGSSNVVMGSFSGQNLETGDYNTLVGESAAVNLTTGGWNTIIGQNAGSTLDTGTGNILIGQATNVPAAATSNYLNIGNAIYGNLSTDSVGIGTTTPAQKLDVEGTILSGPRGTNSGDGGAIRFEELAINGTNTVGFRAPNSIASDMLWELPGIDGSSGQVLQTNGAGVLSWISTASALADDSINFDKIADALVLDTSTDISVGSNVFSITNDGAGNTFVVNDNTGTDTTPFLIDATGNVGVGTTAPSYKLHVTGGTLAVDSGAGTNTLRIRDGQVTKTQGDYFTWDTGIRLNTNSGRQIILGGTAVSGAADYSIASSSKLSLYTNGYANEAIRIETTGMVGIGSTAPRVALDVNGAVASAPSVAVATTTVNYASSNIAHTTQNCQAYALWNLKDGATYTFAVQGTTSTTCSFTAFSGAGTGALTVRMPPGHGATTATFQTLYSFLVAGTTVYVSWVPGY
jgi:hypothetical protein